MDSEHQLITPPYFNDIQHANLWHNDGTPTMGSTYESALSAYPYYIWTLWYDLLQDIGRASYNEVLALSCSSSWHEDNPFLLPSRGPRSEWDTYTSPIESPDTSNDILSMAPTDSIYSFESPACQTEDNNCNSPVAFPHDFPSGLENSSTDADFATKRHLHGNPDGLGCSLANSNWAPLFLPLPNINSSSPFSGSSESSSTIHTPSIETLREQHPHRSHGRKRLSVPECLSCRIRFSRRQDLKRHNTSSHCDRVINLHICDRCDKSFSRRDSMLRHMRKSCKCIKYRKQKLSKRSLNTHQHSQASASSLLLRYPLL
ncbi:hypothetical protein BX666DRAFT_1911659 [Dichotomocladium elegans]|nr:hypothetical protein BX666DRAFT_1911659 [Dichotomocladium elegans]